MGFTFYYNNQLLFNETHIEFNYYAIYAFKGISYTKILFNYKNDKCNALKLSGLNDVRCSPPGLILFVENIRYSKAHKRRVRVQ